MRVCASTSVYIRVYAQVQYEYSTSTSMRVRQLRNQVERFRQETRTKHRSQVLEVEVYSVIHVISLITLPGIAPINIRVLKLLVEVEGVTLRARC